ncbi:hypothetical protein [Algoriphagus sp. Y33]|uniref:hypothetical protein n=1 Tax=Algoriphagus sp. Y33 TaxID=2772483 RepID=UPI0017826D9D|nr:hypothetical protein [Algoriphagus sp. Y33]
MQLMIWLCNLLVVIMCQSLRPLADLDPEVRVNTTAIENIAYLKVGGQTVFDSTKMAYSTLTAYPNQLLFTLMDGEGQSVTLTFAGKDISKRRPEELIFDEPGLFHGYSEAGDVFFIAFGKFAPDRESGQIKYDHSFPQNIMEGKLKVISWTPNEFVLEFEGKLGEEEAVDSPEHWVPFSGKVKAINYQQFDM